ncbi:MAG TPA: hypothetical protein VGH82_05140 [Gaiellaceae bacterium]
MSAVEREAARPKPSDTIAGFMSVMAMAICLIGLAWHPLRLILPGIALAMVAAGMAGPRSHRLAFVGVVVAASCFFFGMLIAVVVQHPLW